MAQLTATTLNLESRARGETGVTASGQRTGDALLMPGTCRAWSPRPPARAIRCTWYSRPAVTCCHTRIPVACTIDEVSNGASPPR
jgi:hypothetical protein